MNDNPELCKKCGGICCQQYPCQYSPEDFTDLSYDGLKAEIDKGYISIDWWEANERSFFLRVKTVWGCITDPSFGGQCILWDMETGCSLPSEQRPKGGRLLVPDPVKCRQTYSKKDCVDEWLPYNGILYELYKNYYDYDPMESMQRMMNFIDFIKSKYDINFD